jgi:hypothetical protein
MTSCHPSIGVSAAFEIITITILANNCLVFYFKYDVSNSGFCFQVESTDSHNLTQLGRFHLEDREFSLRNVLFEIKGIMMENAQNYGG